MHPRRGDGRGAYVAYLLVVSCAASAYDVPLAIRATPFGGALGAVRTRPSAALSLHHRSALAGATMTASGGRWAKLGAPKGRRPPPSSSRRPPGAPRPGPAGGSRRRDPEPQVASIQVDHLPVNLSYVPEREMYTLFCAAAREGGHDEHTAAVLTRTQPLLRAALLRLAPMVSGGGRILVHLKRLS